MDWGWIPGVAGNEDRVPGSVDECGDDGGVREKSQGGCVGEVGQAVEIEGKYEKGSGRGPEEQVEPPRYGVEERAPAAPSFVED